MRIVASIAALAALLVAPTDARAVRRFAVLVANDEGGEGTRPLRYSERDARRMHDVLVRVGGVVPGDAELLVDRDASDVQQALQSIEAKIAAVQRSGERAELLFYYSGHALDGNLRLGDTDYPLAALRERLSSSSAEVRIAFLDACRSGAITRRKGARRAPAFEVDAGPRAARGLVILTSSSNDEDSQESDRITGSFFTHALVSGLLGEADASGDGRVSLAEAYAYAYDRTVAGTIQTSAGPQHPTFSFDLAGNGDVILTDLRGPSTSFLALPAELEGDFVVVDGASRQVAAEIEKRAGVTQRLALAPGAYYVKTRRSDGLRVGEVEVPESGTAALDVARMYDVSFDDDPVKGAGAPPMPHLSLGAGAAWQSFFATPVRTGYFPDAPLASLEGELRDYLRPGWNLGVDLAYGRASGSTESGGVAFPYRFSAFTAGVSLTVEPFAWRLRPQFGIRLALVSLARSFDEPLLEDQSLLTTAPGLVAGFAWSLGESISLYGRVRPSWLLYAADENHSLGFLDAGAGVRMEFR